MNDKTLQFLFKDKIIKIPFMFKHIMDLPKRISGTLIFDPLNQYQVESDVNEDVFQSFIEYLINDKLPEIDIDNINDFFQLSQEFDILKQEIEDKKQELGEYLVNLNGITSNQNDTSYFEEQIALKLDDYLIKYGKNLISLPIQSLFNIFNHKKRKMTKHNLAYEIINEYFIQTNDSNIFILLDSIDGTKLSKSNFEESINLREKRFNHMPTIEFSFVSDLIEYQKQLELKINELGETIDHIQNMYQNDIQMLTEKHEIDKKELIEKSEKDKEEIIEFFRNEIKTLKLNNFEVENENEIRIDKKDDIISCNYKNELFSGIFSYFKNECGDDLSKSGVLNFSFGKTSSSTPINDLFNYDPKRIDDEFENKKDGVADEREGWIGFDFKEKKVNLTSYSMRSGINSKSGYCHPKSWRIVGSNDGKNWDVIHQQINNSSLNGPHKKKHFSCNDNHEFYRYIRYIQEDSWHIRYKYNICLTCFELFGNILDL